MSRRHVIWYLLSRIAVGILLFWIAVGIAATAYSRGHSRGGGVGSSSGCGPDTAPSQASAQGFTCETYRWGSGDSLAEVDTGKTYAPGFKLYLDFQSFGYTGADVSMPSGQLIINPAGVASQSNGPFVVSTCTCGARVGGADGACPGGSSPTFQGFQLTGGFYEEVAEAWNLTGYSCVTGGGCPLGKPGHWNNDTTRLVAGGGFGNEVDNPDGYADNWQVLVFPGPTGLSNTGQTVFVPNTIEPGTNKWGFMANIPANPAGAGSSYWYNDTLNGTTNWTASGYNPNLITSHNNCPGFMGIQGFPITLISYKVWQAPP